MTKSFKTNFSRTIAFLLISTLFQCKSTISVDSGTFSSWFINPSQHADRRLESAGKDLIDSLINDIRKQSKAGTFSETLYDTINTPYILGFRTPVRIKADSSYPLIIYLHGGTGTRINTKGERAFEMLAPLADSMELFFASPSASTNARWWDPTGMSRILQTLRFMTLHYPIDTQKVFLAGVSDGATGCWAAANTIYGPFAGFFAVSGYGGMLPMTGMQLLPDNLMQRPIYNVNAGNDRLYSIETVNRFLDYMMQNGVRVISKTYPDQNHGFDYREQEYGTLCNYLRIWSRPSFKGINCNLTANYPNIPDNVFKWEAKNQAKNSCNGFLNKDTLVIRSIGLTSLVVRFPSSSRHFYVKVNNSNVKKYSGYKPEKNEYLNLMKHSCFPYFSTENLVEIKM